MSTRILVVEDEGPIREGLVELFGVHGFDVDAAPDGLTARAHLARGGYALVVLDLMIPAPSGLELLSELRARGDDTPVLVLTARGAEADVVEGLERGADDYVTKPFGVRELVARARGLLRRHGGGAKGAAAVERIDLPGAVLDVANARLEHGGERLALTARETQLLAFLHLHRDRIVTRAELLVHVWGYRDGSIETRTVDVHVQKLRRKLGVIPGGESWIETARSLGYRLAVG